MRMMKHWVFVIVLAWLGLAGCSTNWRPSHAQVRQPVNQVAVDLRPYLVVVPGNRSLRARQSEQDDTSSFLEHFEQDGMASGSMAAKLPDSLDSYLGDDAPKAGERWALWPEKQSKLSAAFFLEFDPPMTYLPTSIDLDDGFKEQLSVCCYNRDGEFAYRGKLVREIRFEGLESVETLAGSFHDCVRLRTSTSIRIPWGPRFNWQEYIWLAKDLGQVRRIEKMDGWVFPAWFEQVVTYTLAGMPEAQVPTSTKRLPLPQRWVRCAVFLDHVFPSPELGGMLVEFAPRSGDQSQLAATPHLRPCQANR